ncbi:MAG TPA: serine hydrolase domain-containing protein [Terriglobia bacterium]|nr:serine hydrolase domain-containing protein [Terriglobia bacterium]
MRPLAVLGLTVLIGGSLAFPQSGPAPTLASIDGILKNAVSRGDVPGAVIVVTGKDRVLYKGVAGQMNVARHRAMQDTTIFRIASMTKPLTAVATMMLQEEGRLSVDDPVSRYLPALKDPLVLTDFDSSTGAMTTRQASQEILIRHLLSNTSGLGYSFSNPTLKAMMDKTGKPPDELPLLHDPGSQWTYGIGAKVLGRVVEKVSGMTLDQFFDSRIIRPLGMTDTFYLVPAAKSSRVTTTNRRDKNRLVEAANPSRMGSRAMGDGGLYSTGPDYARFLQMLLNNGQARGKTFLRPESVAAMTQNEIGDIFVEIQQTTDLSVSLPFPFGAGKDTFGFGFQIATTSDDAWRRSAGSYSWSGSYNTHFWVDPAREVAVVVLMQVTPFYDERCMKLVADVEEAVGRAIASRSIERP